ncbi:MAG: pyruvate kinase alpha/beta domain-containing protein [Methanocorpusculum sp.]|nr:pyruvate kinase alpha/beta domain-containing protein [Methanocorpusculum sp.]
MKIQKTITYFEGPGKENTKDCAFAALERAKELGIKNVVVASSQGYTAKIFHEAFQGSGIQLIIVTHAVGFSKPGIWEFDADLAKTLTDFGVKIIKGTHSLSGLERAISRNPKLGGSSRTEVIAETLRRTVSVGTKVAVECVLIAADQGAVPINDEVIAVGGTEEGADTVVVIKPSHTANYFDLQVREFVAIPRNR